jgi:hypothetical protein
MSDQGWSAGREESRMLELWGDDSACRPTGLIQGL